MTQRRPGFTLLELLTVIAILGLLMAILMPTLSVARRTAKTKTCLAHLKSVGTSFEIYLNENEDIYPPVRLKTLSPGAEAEIHVNEFNREKPRWQWFLELDLGPLIDPKPFRRLDRPFGDNGLGMGGLEGRTMSHDVFTCPALIDEEYRRDVRNGAFGYNYQYLGNSRSDSNPLLWDNFPVGRHKIRKPGMTVLAADSRGADRRHGRHSYTLDPPRLATERNAVRFGPSKTHYDPDTREGDVRVGLDLKVYAYSPVEARHNNMGNVLFTDTHAETMTLRKLGYQLSEDLEGSSEPPGTPIPVHDPETGPYTASNRMWNGDGVDRIATEQNSPGSEP